MRAIEPVSLIAERMVSFSLTSEYCGRIVVILSYSYPLSGQKVLNLLSTNFRGKQVSSLNIDFLRRPSPTGGALGRGVARDTEPG